jgi:Fic family protein
VQEAESKECIDPYELASKYFHKFLNIHPFLDGNSRLCRLLLNTIILNYTGIIIPIGRDAIESAKFKEVVTRASEVEATEEEYRGSKPAWAEVTTLVAIQGRSTLRALKESLMAGKRGEVCKRRKSIVGYH